MHFNVISQPQSLFNIQKIYFSYGVYKELYSKLVYIHIGENELYICKVSSKPTLSPDMCLIDKSVSISKQSKLLSEIYQEMEMLEIPNVEHLKKISVIIIFTNVWDREKWLNNNLIKLLKQVLQFFIITNNSQINICDLKEFKNLGISFIEVKTIGIDGVGKVVNSTKIKIINCMSMEHYKTTKCSKTEVKYLRKSYDELNTVFLSRSKITESNTLPIPQVILAGPAGCGKKTLVRQICNNTSSVLHIIECSEICRPEPGESESLLKRTFRYASLLSKECMVVLLLLRVEAIGCQSGRILHQMNSILDDIMKNPNLIVIVPTNNPNILNESLRARFLHQIYIGPPNNEERLEMLIQLCKNSNISNEFLLKNVAEFTPGFVLSDLALLVNHVKRYMLLDLDVTPDKALFKKYATLIEPSALRGAIGLVKWNQEIEEIGGLEAVKTSLFQLIKWPLLHTQAFKNLNIRTPSGILLYGPPGCAKTSLIRAIASQSNITFLSVSAADLYSPYVGDAEQTVSELFQRARAAAPSLLFIDEIDALVGNRSERQKGAQERILSAFLTEMDGVGFRLMDGTTNYLKVILVAATNRPNLLDSAFLRPGRLDRLVYVPPPDYQDRLHILQIHSKKIPFDKCVDLEYIAQNTDLFTGADLTNLCREAALEALTKDGIDVKMVQNKHFMNILNTMKPSLTKNIVKWYTEFSFI